MEANFFYSDELFCQFGTVFFDWNSIQSHAVSCPSSQTLTTSTPRNDRRVSLKNGASCFQASDPWKWVLQCASNSRLIHVLMSYVTQVNTLGLPFPPRKEKSWYITFFTSGTKMDLQFIAELEVRDALHQHQLSIVAWDAMLLPWG